MKHAIYKQIWREKYIKKRTRKVRKASLSYCIIKMSLSKRPKKERRSI